MSGNNNANRPEIRAYIGATGSGKGVSVRAWLKEAAPHRLLIWDPLGEYRDFAMTVTKLSEVSRMTQLDAFAVAFSPGGDPKTFAEKFDGFCRIAFAAGNCVVLVEELADVTSPSHAPLAWRRVTTQGRHRGLRIAACSQRPAQVDKQFLGGCTYIRCFTLRYPADRAAMAGAMDVPVTDVAALATVEEGAATTINYMEKDFRSMKTTKGQVVMKRKR